MKEKIYALLAAKFAGVRKDVLNQLARILALQVATDEEAKPLVEKIAETQVADFAKEYRSEVDKEVSEGNKTYESNLKKKFDFVEKKAPKEGGDPPLPDPKNPTDVAAIVKEAVAAAIKPFQAELAGFKADDISKARLQSLNGKLLSCKDDNLKAQKLKDFGRFKELSDEEFTEYLTETETAVTAANQSIANAALGGHDRPLFTQSKETGVSQAVADYVDSKKPENNKFSGKEI